VVADNYMVLVGDIVLDKLLMVAATAFVVAFLPPTHTSGYSGHLSFCCLTGIPSGIQ